MVVKYQVITIITIYTILILLCWYYLESFHKTQSDERTHSNALKIYMYPLPPKFNVDIVKTFKSETIKNGHGIGIPLNISDFVFDTNQFALEQYFYYRLLESAYLTNNSAEADLYYIPFFGNLAKVAGQYHLYGAFWDYMAKNYNLTIKLPTLHKHVIIFGGVRRWAQPFMEHWLVGKMNAVVLERNEGKNTPSDVIVAPYPSQIHFYPDRQDKVNFNKTLLVSSVWNSRYPLRWTLSDMCKKRPDICEHIELLPNNDIYNHSKVYDMMVRSTFCLSPHGDSDTRKAFYDALLVGCINVVYSKFPKLPFDDIIDYEKLTVYIPKENVADTFKILQSLPKEVIEEKQQYIDKNRIHFQYTIMEKPDTTTTVPFEKKDAFNLLLDEIYEKSISKEKLKQKE